LFFFGTTRAELHHWQDNYSRISERLEAPILTPKMHVQATTTRQETL